MRARSAPRFQVPAAAIFAALFNLRRVASGVVRAGIVTLPAAALFAAALL